MKPLTVYDWVTKKRVAYLQNAYNIGYMQQTNSVWTASFTLPYSDEKKIFCNALNYVEIWDIDGGGQDKYIGLFRILSFVEDYQQDNASIVYSLEHVLSDLLDSSIVGKLTLGGAGAENTSAVLTNILTHQNEEKWILTGCDYTNQYAYDFEDENLLDALFSVTKVLTEDYYWSFNTLNFPWGIKLNKVSTIPVSDIRYKKNIVGTTKKMDIRNICTRLYIYGKTLEDGTKVSIASVNGGKAYIDSVSGIANYGIITQIITDDRFETAQSLYDYGVGLLKKLQVPFVSYDLDIQLIYNAGNLKIGDMVRVVTDDGVSQNLVIQQISKDDLTGAPNTGKIIVGNGTTEMGLIVKSFT